MVTLRLKHSNTIVKVAAPQWHNFSITFIFIVFLPHYLYIHFYFEISKIINGNHTWLIKQMNVVHSNQTAVMMYVTRRWQGAIVFLEEKQRKN